MNYIDTISFAANVLTCVSVLGSAIFYWRDKRHDREVELKHEISEIFDYYYEKIRNADESELYVKRVQFMSKLNRLAETVNGKCFSKKYVRKHARLFLKQQNDTFIREYIAQRRKQFKRDDYYSELEKLMNYLEK